MATSVTTTLDVLGNDSDPDGDSFSIVSVTSPTTGTVTWNTGDTTIDYASGSSTGTDSFTYTIEDSTGLQSTATVDLDVNPPGFKDASYSITAPVNAWNDLIIGTPAVTIPPGYSASFWVDWADGPFNINSSGEIYVTSSNPGFTEGNTYSVSVVMEHFLPGNSPDGTDYATVNITIGTPQNAAPTITNDDFSVLADGTLTVDAASGVLANDNDVNNDTLTATLLTDVSNGTLVFNTDGSFTYTPTAAFSGTDSFTYEISDGTDTVGPATATIVVGDLAGETLAAAQVVTLDSENVINVASTLGDGAQGSSDVDLYKVTLQVGQTIIVDLDAQDMPDGSTLSSLDGHLRLFNASGVQVAVNANEENPGGLVSYDSFLVYKATSAGTYYIGLSGAANESYNPNVFGSGLTGSTGDYELNFTLQLPPGFDESSYTLDVPENGYQNLVIGTPAFTIPSGGTGSFSVMDGNGPFNMNSNGEVYVTSATPGFTIGDSFYLTVMMSGDAPNPADPYSSPDYYEDYATINITVTAPANTAPTTADDDFSVLADGVLTVDATSGVLSNDVDQNGDTLTATLLTDVTNGVLTFNADGSFDYTPTATFSGTDSGLRMKFLTARTRLVLPRQRLS